MYMKEVGIAELRQNLSKHLARVRAGERLVVTDRNRPVAMLGPAPGAESVVDRLIAEGKLLAPEDPTPRPFTPVRLPGGPADALSRALQEMRDEDPR